VHLDAALAARGGLRAAQLRVAIVALLPDEADGACDLFVARAVAQQRAKIVAVRGEESQV